MLFHNLFLTPEAEDDLADIVVYTVQQWGEKQAEKYRNKIEKALSTLQATPFIERLRDDIMQGCRIFMVERHSIVYVLQKNEVLTVVRIIAQRMDIHHHISRAQQ